MAGKKTRPKAAAASAVEKDSLFDRLYFYFFLLLPLVYSTKTVDPVLVPRQLLVSVFVTLTGGLVLYRFSTKRMAADFSVLRLAIVPVAGVFLLSILVSFFQSHLLSESIYVFSRIFIEVVFFLLTTFLIVQRQLRLKAIVNALFGMGVIILLIGLYQLFTLDLSHTGFSENTYNVQSSMAHKNLFASLLFLVFPFLLMAAATKSRLRIGAIALVVTGTLLLWLLQARTVLVALAVAAFVYAAFALRYRLFSLNAKAVRAAVLSGAAAIVLVVAATCIFRDTFAHIFYTESIRERVGLWQNTGKMIGEHPLLGVGAGNWQIRFPEGGVDHFGVDRVKAGLTTFQRPHNDFLWIFSEAGIPGILSYCAVFGCAFFYLVRLLRRTKDRTEKHIHAILFAALCGYIVIAALDFPLERIEHQLVVWLLLAIVTANYFRTFFAGRTPLTTKVPVYFVLAGGLFSLYVAFQRNDGERHTQNLYGARQLGNWDEVIAEADLATNRVYEIDPTSVPLAWYKGVAYFAQEDFRQAQLEFAHANRVHPHNIHVMNNLASCYEKLGRHEEAIRYYRKALRYSSRFEEPRLNLSAVYFNTGRYEDAFRTIDACDTACSDPKYEAFLPAILRKKIETMQQDGDYGPEAEKRLEALKTNDDNLRKLYLSAKRAGKSLENAVLSAEQAPHSR